MSRIIILDANFAGEGSVWSAFSEFDNLECVPVVKQEEVPGLAADAEVIVVSRKIAFDAALLDELPKLKYISLLSTGYNSVDLEECGKRGIVVSNVPGYSSDSVAQTAFALVLELVQGCGEFDTDVKSNHWSKHEDSIYKTRPFLELAGLSLGIFGFGAIGQKVAKIAQGFGMNILACCRSDKAGFENVEFVDQETLFKQSDILTLHCPLTDQTKNLINSESLELMKKTAYLINTSRGGVVNEDELAQALNSEAIAGAGLDVMVNEPPNASNPLLAAKNTIILPHIAWTSSAARMRLVNTSAKNVKSYLDGAPINVVSA
jgi:glycerate dehydrogenase